MLGRTVIGSLLITLLTFPSTANEKALRMQQCYKALAAVESQLNNQVIEKNLNEQQIDEVNLILDEADKQCNKSNLKKAKQTIEKAKKILETPTEEKLN